MNKVLKFFTLLAVCLFLNASGVAARNIYLNMYYPVAVGGPITQIIDGMIAEFEKTHDNIKVKAVYAGNYDDTRVKAMAALKAKEPVQLSVLFSIDMFDLIDQDLVIPFDELATTSEDRRWLKSFYPGLMENGTFKEKTYGIPFQRSTIVMYYNKDAFRAAGLNPNKPPATWDELVQVGKKLTKRNSSGSVTQWGLHIPSTGYPYWMFQALCIQNGQKLMNGDGTKTYFDAPATIEALQFWRDLGAKHKIMPKGTVNWGTQRQKFLEGKTAIMWHSTGNLTPVKKNARFDFGVAMLPAKERRGTPTGGGNFYIFKQASPEEQKAAFTFIKFMTAAKRSAHWSKSTGYMGVSPAAYKVDSLSKYVKVFPAASVARDQLQYATAEFSTYETARVKKHLNDAIQSVLIGKKAPKSALKKAQSVAKRVLRSY